MVTDLRQHTCSRPVPTTHHVSRPQRATQRRQRVSVHVSATPEQVQLKLGTQQDYWAVSDLHCTVFNDPPRGLLETLWQRFERIFSLQINDSLERGGMGKAAYIVAWQQPTAAAATQQAPWQEEAGCFEFPAPGYWLLKAVDTQVQPGIGPSYKQQGLLGVAMLDTFGDLIPPRELDAQRDGAMGWFSREGIAYVSNVAVAPEARRAGVARCMMQEAERLAAEWGFRAVGLHCNAKNTAAVELYKSLGYKQTVLEPVWMPWVQGRPPDRCHFMLKRLPAPLLAEAKAAAAAVEEQQGSAAGSDGSSSTEAGRDQGQEGEAALAAGSTRS